MGVRSISRAAILAAVMTACALSPAAARMLVINANTSDPAPRAAWEEVVGRFGRQHPDIKIDFNVYDHESYKRSIRNWLTSVSPDVVFWFVGTRMRQFVKSGLLADVSALFTPDVVRSMHKGAVDLVSDNGRQYGVPYAYYQVGIYYRRDVLEGAGVTPPLRWPQLLDACVKLRERGIVPFAIGSKQLWPTAMWFDYLNLRINGYDFHMQVMNGLVPYTDGRIKVVFAAWKELLDRQCFAPSHVSVSWQESQMLFNQGKAAMMLLGNYLVANLTNEVRRQTEFIPFPTIDPAIGRYEDAPMNSIHIPANARNKDEARLFLSFVLRADVQEAIGKRMLLIPANTQADVVDDRFVRAGRDLIAGADKLAQFFDRDTDEGLAASAMKGFQEFMVYPDRLDRILSDIERVRRQVYGN